MSTFNPKITYRMAAMHLPASKPTTPWQYVKNWSMSDKGPHETLEALNERMQNRWPGKYMIVAEQRWNGLNYYINDYKFKFNSPADKTMFILKYS